MFKRLSLPQKTGIIAVITAVLLFAAKAAFDAIFGGLSYTLFLNISSLFIATRSWPWVISLVILVICLGFVLFFWQRTNHERKVTKKIVALDTKLLMSLPCLISAPNPIEEVQRLVHTLLNSLLTVLDGTIVLKASLFLPDADNPEYLIKWENYPVPPKGTETAFMKKFYIGNEASKAEKRGLAGEAFINRQIECVHISADRNGKYKTDREGVFLLFNEEHPYMPYRTYVCVPVVDKELNGECLGVLCFNSTYPSAFNSARVKEKLAILATRIASVLLIYEEIEKIGSQIGGHQVQLNPGGVVTSN